MEVQANRDRPESWDAKMPISGKPLITEKQFAKLLANAPRSLDEAASHDPVPVVKIFLPHVRWLLGWIDPDDHDSVYAVRKFGEKRPEIGMEKLSDIVAARLGMMKPERDLYIKLDKPMTHYLLNRSGW